ncbi:MAG: hypothetical protein OXQ93_13955 [Gemmatimonadota bacterium]|nr:hypothetical protein [Gemmatimonadota bacterium]
MGDTRSGAGQTLEVGGLAMSGPGSGFGGLTLSVDPATYSEETDGFLSQRNAGSVVLTGDFTVSETAQNVQMLLGAHGTRQTLRWRKAAGLPGLEMTAILAVSRTWEDRGRRSFSVSFTVDGPPEAWPA